MSVLSISDLTVSFATDAGRLQALKDVSIDVPETGLSELSAKAAAASRL